MRELVQEIGAVAAWATAVGLVVLWAVHMSHAREVRRLRRLAGRAPARTAGARYVAVAVAGALAVGGYGVTRWTGDDSGASHKPQRHSAVVKPGRVTVAVLNGTMIPGLAARLRDRIAAAGFSKGAINDFSDKQLAESVVQYSPGHLAAAKAVGRTVGVSRREPVTAGSRALAGDATVIVIAGADKAGGA